MSDGHAPHPAASVGGWSPGLARLGAHFRTPLYREGYALMLSAGVASALGLAYWIIAARSYTPDVVGLNAAAISAMLFLSGIAQLNLVSALTRFIPEAGPAAWRLVAWCYAVSLAVSAIAAAIFVAGVDLWAERVAFLRSSVGFAAWFVAATMLWSVFTLQDSVLTGLRRAIWVPVDNALFAVAKIGLLAIFAASVPRYGIFASWTLGAVLSVIVINALLAARLIPSYTRSSLPAQQLAGARQIRRFVAADYVGGLFWIASSTLLPIVVTERLGASANAYYTLAWVMTMPLYLATANIGSSLVVSAITERGRLREYARAIFGQTLRVVVPAALAVSLFAPLVLRVFGGNYASEAAPVLRLLALSAIPNVVCVIYLSVWRAEQRLSLLVSVRAIQFTAVVACSIALLGPYGIKGPAIAWLVVQTIVAASLVLRWPGVLAAAGRGPLRRLLLLARLRNASVDLGVLPAAQRRRDRPRRAQRDAAAAGVVPAVLRRLEELLSEPTRSWRLQGVAHTVTDMTVGFVGPPRAPARAVFKVPASDGASHSLVHEAEALAALSADPRLAGWRSLLPEVLAFDQVGDRPVLVERAVPGVDGRRLLGRADLDAEAVRGSIFTAIEGLHHLTAAETVVGEAHFDLWVARPCAVLERHVDRHSRRPWRQAALARLRDELAPALVGRPMVVSWIHGDCAPENVLLAPTGRAVTGFIDWELAGTPRLPVLDTLQLVLSTRTLVRRREYGDELLRVANGGLSDSESLLLRRSGPADVPLSAALRLGWLHHTSSMLTKSPRYADNWLWVRSNLDAPLAALA
jgi:O-antigen/teichoic acid export membrane protein/aminoglycoside phosphotransferase